MNTKNNQRFRYMDVCMKAALLELMQQMDFEKITVKDICKRAGVNRSTFYAHYTDIYQMLDENEEYLSQGLIDEVEKQKVSACEGSSPFLPYLHYMKQHRYFYRVVLQNRKTMPVRKSFAPLWEQLVAPQCRAAGITDEETLLYYAVGFQASVSAVLQRWIETDCAKPESELAAILQQCVPKIRM